MKIALFDSYVGKFTKDMEDWWVAKGHEVRRDAHYDPQKALWADIIWFDTCDNNLLSATNPHDALLNDPNNFKPWALYDMDLTNKKVIVRPIDIEVWLGHHAPVDWALVDECIFIAPHIRDIMMADSRPASSLMRVHTIPCGVDLNRYKFAQRQPGFDIGVVSEKWVSKGTDLILQIALKLKQVDPRYKIHWLGRRGGDAHWDVSYFDDFVGHNDLPIIFTDWIDSENAVDEFLEDKNYLLHASHKEAFSYATAEAMAKGIKPVLHRFFGADAFWPNMTWSSIDEAIEMITSPQYDSSAYKKFLLDHEFTIPQMMAKIDKILEI